jgi:predicted MFS family arabinose efflux permease
VTSPAIGGWTPLVLRLWLPFSLGYLLSFGIRNVNAVLVPSLTQEFDLTASQLGLLTSVFFLAFVAAQLPGGLLMDRFGPRRVNAVMIGLAGIGCLAFAFAPNYQILFAGRCLIGLGMAMCLMASIKAFTQWLPLERLPMAGGLLLTFGGLGGLAATAPVEWALQWFDWRSLFVAVAITTFGVGLFLYSVAPDRREAGAGDSLAALATGFLVIAREPRFWRIALPSSILGMAGQAMQALWIGPWLRDVARLDRPAQVYWITAFMLAATLGFVFMGSIVDRLLRRGFDPFSVYKVHASASVVFLCAIMAIDGAGAIPLWAFYFFAGNAGMLIFTNLARIFPPALAGRFNAFNVMVFFAVFVCQWTFGVVLDLWPVTDGRYAIEGYRAALGGIVVLQTVSALALLSVPRLPPMPAREPA